MTADAWLLVQYEEGYANTEGPMSTWTVQDDYYNPVVLCKTREELVEFVGTENVHWSGDTAVVDRFNWRGEHKGTDIYHAIKVEFGKYIVY